MADKRKSEKQRMREYIALLEMQRSLLAMLALPKHPKGGFHNPLIAWRAQDIAAGVLEGRAPRMELAVTPTEPSHEG